MSRALVIVLWLTAVAAGFRAWDRYDSTPGKKFSHPLDDVSSDQRPRLVMYVHPHCPCTRASFAEFAEIVAAVKERCRFRIVFVRPDGVGPGWERTELWEQASELPGVEVGVDTSGEEADRVGATTSGHAILYDAGGKAVFVGGVTRSRGQRGESAGRDAILAALGGREKPTTATDVFGCPLRAPTNCSTDSDKRCRE